MTPNSKEEELRILFNQWLDGRCNEQAIRSLSGYADDPELSDAWYSLLAGVSSEPPAGHYSHTINEVYQRLVAAQPELLPQVPVRRMSHIWRYAAAILITILAGGIGYFLFTNGHHNTKEKMVGTYNIVPANSNKAVLTLGNGTKIQLDQPGKDQLLKQADVAIDLRSDSGYIAYRQRHQDHITAQAAEYNTLTTPKGGEFKVVLPDGTSVWLNAASSVTFPTAFNGSTREVTITGEAYFEVARNTLMPFRVKINNSAAVEVLGTHFNISAYSEEEIVKTTLLEGAIRLTRGKEIQVLKPGQQAVFDKNNSGIRVTTVDVTEAVAWKNGTFDFREQDISTVMNQIGRWYNVEIVYEGEKPEGAILGMISRNTDLITVLNSLALTSGFHFSTEAGRAPGQQGKIIIRK